MKYKYFLNTIADKSLCYGPGLQEDQQAGQPDRFTIQAINELGENRTSGADEFRITLQNYELVYNSNCYSYTINWAADWVSNLLPGKY